MRLWLKVLLVLGMTLAILVPLTMIRGSIPRAADLPRAGRRRHRPQLCRRPGVLGPRAGRAVHRHHRGRGGRQDQYRAQADAHWTFFPTTLDVRGPLTPSTRKRDLHEVRVYEWKASANARFDVTIPRDTPPPRCRPRPCPQDRPSLTELRFRRRARPDDHAAPGHQRRWGDRGGRPGQPRRRGTARAPGRATGGAASRAADHAGFHPGRHRVAGAGAAGQEQHVRDPIELAAPAIRRQLPAARAPRGQPGLRRDLAGRLGGDERAAPVPAGAPVAGPDLAGPDLAKPDLAKPGRDGRPRRSR